MDSRICASPKTGFRCLGQAIVPFHLHAGVLKVRGIGYDSGMDIQGLTSHPLALWICLGIFAILVEIWIIWRTTAKRGRFRNDLNLDEKESLSSEMAPSSHDFSARTTLQEMSHSLENMSIQLDQNRADGDSKYAELSRQIQLLKVQMEQFNDLRSRISTLEAGNSGMNAQLDDLSEHVKRLEEKDTKKKGNPLFRAINDLLSR